MLGSIGYFYYHERLLSIDRICGVSMQNIAMHVETTIRNKNDTSKFFDHDRVMKVAFYTKDKKVIKSKLSTQEINFEDINHRGRESAFYIKKLEHPINNIHYIVIEDSKLTTTMHELKKFIWFSLFLASIFIAFIGYFLSRLLLNPVKENFAMLSRFMKDSAHELNTPVTALMMSANYLKKKYDKEMVEHMLMSSKMISETYNSIAYLAFHDLDIEIKEEFDLAEHIHASIKYFQEIAASKNININTELNTLIINMDKNSMRKLINNLISNAIKYSYKNKSIDISLQDNILKIKDQGLGIDKENQKKIFKRYKRVNTKGSGGFGIGLDIVMGICRSNNIEISLESEIKKGSTFTLVFP
ncbi:MAG: Two-component system histidine kinase DccS [uncultured Sulfurovum sp.]|uniref:histidine kinase n=1 Tax=uncultured Sulfurovum sp. TaxID=269237 RepID=A0A6S6SWB9_9BACT|nr:MAG: Two-component system histidine kinase DccS [uncultured Sulfurovum sp.]